MIDKKLQHVEFDDDPRRCQAVHAKGQCKYISVEGSKYCQMHGGNKAGEAHQQKIMRQYNLAQWQARVGEFAEHEQVKGLREEIGILRLLLENIIRQCKSPGELMLYASKISEIVGKIEKLVVSCNRLESSMGMLLDKAAALQLAGQMVEIISKYISDDEAIDAIAGEFATAIANLNGAESKED